MRNSALTILTVLALLALPLAAQVPEEEQTLPETIEQEAEEFGQEVEQETEELGQEIEQEVDETFDTESESTAAVDDDDELPQTASPLAALALLGLAGAGSALGVRVARRK